MTTVLVCFPSLHINKWGSTLVYRHRKKKKNTSKAVWRPDGNPAHMREEQEVSEKPSKLSSCSSWCSCVSKVTGSISLLVWYFYTEGDNVFYSPGCQLLNHSLTPAIYSFTASSWPWTVAWGAHGNLGARLWSKPVEVQAAMWKTGKYIEISAWRDRWSWWWGLRKHSTHGYIIKTFLRQLH